MNILTFNKRGCRECLAVLITDSWPNTDELTYMHTVNSYWLVLILQGSATMMGIKYIYYFCFAHINNTQTSHLEILQTLTVDSRLWLWWWTWKVSSKWVTHLYSWFIYILKKDSFLFHILSQFIWTYLANGFCWHSAGKGCITFSWICHTWGMLQCFSLHLGPTFEKNEQIRVWWSKVKREGHWFFR